MTIDHYYWEYDYEHYYARQMEKEALKSHFQKQRKAFTSGPAMASQNKANPSLVASSTKISLKLSLSLLLSNNPIFHCYNSKTLELVNKKNLVLG